MKRSTTISLAAWVRSISDALKIELAEKTFVVMLQGGENGNTRMITGASMFAVSAYKHFQAADIAEKEPRSQGPRHHAKHDFEAGCSVAEVYPRCSEH